MSSSIAKKKKTEREKKVVDQMGTSDLWSFDPKEGSDAW